MHHEVVQMALKHQCPDCPETRLADSPPQVSLYQSDTPWKVIVLDNAEFRVGNQVTHFMLICDEATHFVAVAQLFQRHFEEGRNATGEEALRAVEQTWIQNYGYPDRVRLDPEGCFRSRLLEDWAKRVRKDAMTLLHGEQMEPFRAPLNVVAAHDTLHRRQGFSPAQWCFGRNFTIDGRLFESEQTVPVLQGMNDPRHAFGKSMNARLAAEEVYRKSQASFQLSRALNMKTRPQRVYLPGDLVYYRREKAPADTPAHEELGIPNARMARWWGPARVLSSETRSDELTRRAAQVVWIVAAGRLKRCSPDQLRHASEREVILANSTHDTITPGWTFHSLLQGMQAGNFDIYDNYQLPEDRAAVSRKGAASKPPRVQDPCQRTQSF